MAIEDAYVLARELVDSKGNIPLALSAYEATRIPRTARVQIASRREGEVLHVGHSRAGDQLTSGGRLQAQQLPGFNRDWLYDYDPAA